MNLILVNMGVCVKKLTTGLIFNALVLISGQEKIAQVSLYNYYWFKTYFQYTMFAPLISVKMAELVNLYQMINITVTVLQGGRE